MRYKTAWLRLVAVLACTGFCEAAVAQVVDIRSVAADLQVPPLKDAAAAPGARVKQVHPDWRGTQVYHTLYLPTNYQQGQRHPVIVELPGNGGFESQQGDTCTGVPEGCSLGYGISAGKDFIWVCMPFVDGAGKQIAEKWWGNPPEFSAAPSVEYLKTVVPWICEAYGGDPQRVILVGFSRGAIACNYIGLYDDEISKLWCGMVPYSHYDGVRKWPFSGHDPESSLTRLERLGNRPQFICQEGGGPTATQQWIESTGVDGSFTFAATGFHNHNDAWALRPSPAREELRQWVAVLIAR